LLTDAGAAETQRAAFGAVMAGLAAPEGLPSDAAAIAVLEMLQKGLLGGSVQTTR
jgi:hypothetical protein